MTERAGILHIDMDAFFVSVELLDRPELRGRPVVVGGTGARGVVAAASYEARAYGIRSAMPSAHARRLCPDAVFLHGRHDRYSEVSARVMAIFRDTTPLVEPLSLDEAFLDVSGALRIAGPAVEIAQGIRQRVVDEEGLTCSIGVAGSKFVAKVASEFAKPRASIDGPVFGSGIHVVEPSETIAFLRPLPVESLWGVGPATLTKLHRMGVTTIADLADLPVENVVAAIGRSHALHLHALANGRDDRVVEPARQAKSVGHEETFPHDLRDRDALDRELVVFADAVASRLRSGGLVGRTVQLKVRFGDFTTITRSTTLPAPVDDPRTLLDAGRRLLHQVDVVVGVRLLGLSVSGLSADNGRQPSLDEALGPGWTEVTDTIDEIRARFGSSAIGPAVVVGPDGPGRGRRADRQWGPAADAGDPD